MASAPWKTELLDTWRRIGDEEEIELHAPKGGIFRMSVDTYIREFVQEIQTFVKNYCRTPPGEEAMPTYRKPPDPPLQSADTYGDVAIQGILHYLFTSKETPDTMDAVMAAYFAARAADTTSRYTPETYQVLEACFRQSSMLGLGIQAYFLTPRVPSWAVDPALIRKGEEFYARHAFEIGTILMCASLPLCYCNSRGVKALVMTHALTRGVFTRIIETTRFAIGVMQPGALEHWEGDGIRIACNVRLLHAYNRYRLRTRVIDGEQWDEATLGAPLNQEDLAMTLMTFSTVVVDGLRKMSLTVPSETEDAYFHAWRYVGFLIGIPDALIPDTPADGRALLDAIAERQFKPLEPGATVSKDGKAIADALREFMEQALARIGQSRFKGWPATKTRYLIGNQYADLLDVPRADWTFLLVLVIRLLHRTEALLMRDVPRFNSFTQKVSRLVFDGIAAGTHPDGRPMLLIPEDGAGISRVPSPPTVAVVSTPLNLDPVNTAAFSVNPGATASQPATAEIKDAGNQEGSQAHH